MSALLYCLNFHISKYLTENTLCNTIQTPAFSCAGDYQNDNHPKTPPYISKSVQNTGFLTHLRAKIVAQCEANS